MKAETTMSAAFAKVGFVPRQMQLYAACMEFLDKGGTRAEWIAVFDAVKRLPGESHPSVAGIGQFGNAPARQANGESGGHVAAAGNGQLHDAPIPPPVASGEGQSPFAHPGQPSCAVPAREPSAAFKSASRDIGKRIALNAFERELTHTGRMWGNVSYRELDSMSDDGAVAQAIKAHIGALRGDERHKLVKELMTPREFAILIKKVRDGK